MIEVPSESTGLQVVQPGLEPAYQTPPGSFQPQSAFVTLDQPEKPNLKQQRICGLSRAIFWLALAIAILATILVGVAMGLGIGLGTKQSSPQPNSTTDPSNASSTSMSTYAPTISPPATVTVHSNVTVTPTTTSTSSSALPSVSNPCPDADGSIKTLNVGQKTFRYKIHCTSDFGDGKEDLGSIVLSSFEDCISLCNSMNYFQGRTDVGASFHISGGNQDPGTCWCEGGTKKGITSNPSNVVADLIEE